MEEPMARFLARLYRNPASDLSIESLTGRDAATTPGNVGICLCGGGSRALSAGMGQLRALNTLTTANGKSLLSQTKSISTVSGGSWLGIAFECQNMVSDAQFLGAYLKPEDLTAKNLETLDSANIAYHVTKDFSVPDIAIQALVYHVFSGTPADMLWQTVIGKHLLSPYGLYKPGRHSAPTQAFSYSAATVNEILKLPDQNSALRNTDFVTLSPNAPRPYFVCNTSMFVEGASPDHGGYEYLAPVQCTPFFSGIVGAPTGVDANNSVPGGGGVTSYAFNSTLDAIEGSDLVSIDQSRPWSVMDIVGASSAAFAETVVDKFKEWKSDPSLLLKDLHDRGRTAVEFVKDDLEPSKLKEAEDWLERLLKLDPASHRLLDSDRIIDWILGKVIALLDIEDLVPCYDYWPVADATPAEAIKPTAFADGGNLENTGVASTLSYGDIDKIVAFINSPTLLSPARGAGPLAPAVEVDTATMVVTTDIEVDAQIPLLFGYQPFSKGMYVPYDGGKNISATTAYGVHNKVFPEKSFADLLQHLWEAADGSQRPAVYRQTLDVVDNPWFGVKARQNLVCVWVYTSTVNAWEERLSDEAKALLATLKKFPNFDTLNTELTPVEIGLLASLSSWCVANEATRQVFADLYQA